MLEIGDTCAGLFDQVRSVPGPIQSPDTRLWACTEGHLRRASRLRRSDPPFLA
jgi:hypothetical protein